MPKVIAGELMPMSGVSNDAAATVNLSNPYIVRAKLVGVSPLIFHRWSVESVDAKAKAAKGSKAKKCDDVESYVWRLDDGTLGLPGEYVRQSVIGAARFRQDPRSPRKSALDLFKAGVLALTDLAPLNGGVTKWDFEDARRVQVQRNGITRIRPAFRSGWSASVDLLVNLPEYIPPDVLHETMTNAGRLIGVGDNRPSYGRFQITEFAFVGE